MAYHRTKSEKQKAQQYRQHHSQYTYQSKSDGTGASDIVGLDSNPQSLQVAMSDRALKPLVRTEPALIKRDLLKTFITTLFLVTLLLGMYAWTRYNGFRLPFLS